MSQEEALHWDWLVHIASLLSFPYWAELVAYRSFPHWALAGCSGAFLIGSQELSLLGFAGCSQELSLLAHRSFSSLGFAGCSQELYRSFPYWALLVAHSFTELSLLGFAGCFTGAFQELSFFAGGSKDPWELHLSLISVFIFKVCS